MLDVIVFFRNPEGKLARFEEYKDVKSAEVWPGYYKIINKGGTRIKIPLTSIDQIIENEYEEEEEETNENRKKRDCKDRQKGGENEV